jgi:DNA-binding PadR family transcriptional regulator
MRETLRRIRVKNLSVNEQIFLVAIWWLQDESYGVRIRDKIKEITGRTFTFGTLYNTLDNLAKKGYVTSRAVQILNQTGGNKRVYYEITKVGLEALRESRELQNAIWKGLGKQAFLEKK